MYKIPPLKNTPEARFYDNIHHWINRHFGKAKKCEFCFIKNRKRYHWALRKGYKYEKNINNFIQLCVSCHFKYDCTPESRENKRRSKMGNHCRPKVPVFQYDLNGKLIQKFESLISVKEKLGISKSNISNAIRGRSKTSGGFIWRYA